MPEPLQPDSGGATVPDVHSPVSPPAPSAESSLSVSTPEPGAYVAQQDWTPAQREAWDKTGVLPRHEVAPAAPAPSEPEDAEPASPAARFVRAAKPPGISRRQHELNETIRFATEMAQRNRELETRLGQEPAQPAAREHEAPATARSVATLPPDPNDPEPTLEQFADQSDPYAAWMRATTTWDRRQEARQAEQMARARAQEHDLLTRLTTFIDRRDAYAKTNPQFLDRTQWLLDQLTPGTPIGTVVMDSAAGCQMVEYFASHVDELNRIARLPPGTQLRELGKIEGRLERTSAPALASASAEPVASPKHLTSAPAPPVTLGTHATAPVDDVLAAIDRKDFRAYDAAQTRRELATHRG